MSADDEQDRDRNMVARIGTTDAARLRRAQASFAELTALQARQRATTAEMVRACIACLRSPLAAKRREGIDGLTILAETLERPL